MLWCFAGFVLLILAVAYLANKSGKETANTLILKKEAERIAKEQGRYNAIHRVCGGLPNRDIRVRLRTIPKSKQ